VRRVTLQDAAGCLLACYIWVCCKDWKTAAVQAVSEELATALPQDWRQLVGLIQVAV
jgi:hypothetical protein